VLAVAFHLQCIAAECETVAYYRTCGMFDADNGAHSWWPTPVNSEFGCAQDLTTREVDGTDFGVLSGDATFIQIDLHPGVALAGDIARGFIRDSSNCSPFTINNGGNGAYAAAMYGANTNMFQITFAVCIDVTVPEGLPGPAGVCNAWQDRRSLYAPYNEHDHDENHDSSHGSSHHSSSHHSSSHHSSSHHSSSHDTNHNHVDFWDTGTDPTKFKWSHCPNALITIGNTYFNIGGNGTHGHGQIQLIEFNEDTVGEVQEFVVQQECGLVYTGTPFGNLRGAIATHDNGMAAIHAEVCYRTCSDFTPAGPPPPNPGNCSAWAHHRALAHAHYNKDNHWHGNKYSSFDCDGLCPPTPNIDGNRFATMTIGISDDDLHVDVLPGLTTAVRIAGVTISSDKSSPQCTHIPVALDGQSVTSLSILDYHDKEATVCLDECTNINPTPNGNPPRVTCLTEVAYRSRFNPDTTTDATDWRTSTNPGYYTCSTSVCPNSEIVDGDLFLSISGNEDTMHVEVKPGVVAELDHFCARKSKGPYVDGVVSTNLQEADAQYIDGDYTNRAEICYRVCTEVAPETNVTIDLPPFVNNETFTCTGGTINLPPGWTASTPPNTVSAVLGPACTMTLQCGETAISPLAGITPRYLLIGSHVDVCILRGYAPFTFVYMMPSALLVTDSDMELTIEAPGGFGALVTMSTRLTGPNAPALIGVVSSWTATNLILDGDTGLDGIIAGSLTFNPATVTLTGELINGPVQGDVSLTTPICTAATLFSGGVTGDITIHPGSLVMVTTAVAIGMVGGNVAVTGATAQGANFMLGDIIGVFTATSATLSFSACLVTGDVAQIMLVSTTFTAQCGVTGTVSGPTVLQSGSVILTGAFFTSTQAPVSFTDVSVAMLHLVAGVAGSSVTITDTTPGGIPGGFICTGAVLRDGGTDVVVSGGTLAAPSISGQALANCLTLADGASVTTLGAAIVTSATCISITNAVLTAGTAIGGALGTLSLHAGGSLRGGTGAAGNVGTVSVDAAASVNIAGTFVVGDVTTLTLAAGATLRVGTGFAGTLPHFELTDVTVIAAADVVSGTTPTLSLHSCAITAGGTVITGSLPAATVDSGSVVGCTTVVAGSVATFTLHDSAVVSDRLVRDTVDTLDIQRAAVNTTLLAERASDVDIELATIRMESGSIEGTMTFTVRNSTVRATSVCVVILEEGTVDITHSTMACGSVVQEPPP
jgi:hypothetical protein